MGNATLPELISYYPDTTRYIEVFNRGGEAFDFSIEADADYVRITPASGSIELETRVEIGVDWSQAPAGESIVTLTATGADGSVDVQLPLHKPEAPAAEDIVGFVESNGYVSINAEDFTEAVSSEHAEFEVIPDLGRTSSAVTINPPNADSVAAGGDSPHLQYNVHLFSGGQVTVRAYFSPTLPIHSQGLRYAVSFDDAAPQVVDIHSEIPMDFAEDSEAWQRWVSDNIIVKQSTHMLSEPGAHVLKFWMVDAAVVLQKLVIETDTVPPSYLGPPGAEPLNYPEPPVVDTTDTDTTDSTLPTSDDSADTTAAATSDDTSAITTADTTAGGPDPDTSDETNAGNPDATDATGNNPPVSPGTSATSPAPTAPIGSDGAPVGTGDPAPPAGTSDGVVDSESATDDGCGCSVPGQGTSPRTASIWALGALGLITWRRRRDRRA